MHVNRLCLMIFWILCSAGICHATPEGKTQATSPRPEGGDVGRILDVHVGGAGRFLILRLVDRLAIFDTLTSQTIAHVVLSSEDAVIAAGNHLLVVIDPNQKRIEHWSLPAAQKLSESPLNFDMNVGYAAIGAASDGPLLLVPQECRWPLEEVRLLNLNTLAPVVDEIDLIGRAIVAGDIKSPGFATASDDGTTFYVAPAGLLLRVDAKGVVGQFCSEHEKTNWMQPDRQGRYLFGWAVPLDQEDTKARKESITQSRASSADGQITIHDRGGSYYLSMRPAQNGSGLEAYYMSDGDSEPLGKVPGILLETGTDRLPVGQRVHLNSRDGLITTIDDRIGRLRVHHIGPGNLLPPLDSRRLALRSPLRLTAHANRAFTHRVRLVGMDRETKFEVIGAPHGLTIDEQGILHWLPPELDKDLTIHVDLRVSLGENQTIHPMAIVVRSAGEKSSDANIAQRIKDQAAVARWLIDPPSTAWLAEQDPHKLADAIVKLGVKARPSIIRPAAEGRALVFRQPGAISILSTASGNLIASLPAPHTGTRFATGLECVIVHDPVDQTLTRWRLSDLTISHQVQVPFEGEARLMLLGASSDGPLIVGGIHSNELYRFDSQTLAPLRMPSIRDPNQRPNLRPTPIAVTGISENGMTHSATRGNDLISLVPVGLEYQVYARREIRPSTVRMSSDGSHAYVGESVFDRRWAPQPSPTSSGVSFPAVSGPLICAVKGESYQVGSSFRPQYGYQIDAQIYHHSLPESISTLNDLPISGLQMRPPSPILDHEQIWFVPSVNRLVRFDAKKLQFEFYQWDVETALERVQTLLPIVVSSPHVWVRPGRQWSYQLKAFPRGRVTYQISAGPLGMQLDDSGKATWNVPADVAEGKHHVIITAMSEYGKEEPMEFDLHVMPSPELKLDNINFH